MYIPKGVTITCNGVAGDGSRQGGAGIYLPNGSNLYVLGDGTLVANDGRAGNGSNGGNGGSGSKSGSKYTSGSGGAGGAGGGGAGAGIGTHGAAGCAGGGGGAGGAVTWSNKGKAQFTGKDGSAGSAGSSPSASGNIYKTSTVTVKAYGGAAGSNGNGGSAGGYQTDKGTGWDYNHCAAGGGAGGGGGAGYAGNGIGAGGAGGGGGAGGSGACDYHSNTDYNCIGGGQGGYGGYGAAGQAGKGGNAHSEHTDKKGGNPGGTGGGGNTGSSKSATNFNIDTSTNIKWSVTFTGATSNGTQYYSFNSTNITVSDYVPSGKNLFLGWKVKTYAKNTNGTAASRPLTTAENVLYQPGQTITTALGTYGNITLNAITMPYDGKIAQDKLTVAKKYFASSSPTTPTYYTYAIVVNGGSFYKFNPSNCAAEGAETNFVAEGYMVEQNDNYYVVVSNC